MNASLPDRQGIIAILWARHWDEAVVAIFATECRRLGLAVKVVGIDGASSVGAFGLHLQTDCGLTELMAMADQIRAVIIPASLTRLQTHQNDPRLWTLLQTVARQGAYVLVREAMTAPDETAPIPASIAALTYPTDHTLTPFARAFAQQLRHDLWIPRLFEPSPQTTERKALYAPHQKKGIIMKDDVIRVAADTYPAAAAGAIAGQIRQKRYSQVQAIGASAVNQMMKATIIARRYLEEEGYALVCVPDFIDTTIDGQQRTALRLWCGSMNDWHHVADDAAES